MVHLLHRLYGVDAPGWPSAHMHETITFLLVTLLNIYQFKKKFTHRLSNEPFLIWSLTTPSHLKYVATLPCNLSLMACFADINVSQGSVATNARCGGIFDVHLTANLPGNMLVKNRLRFDRIMVMSLWPRFFGPPCRVWHTLPLPNIVGQLDCPTAGLSGLIGE